MPAEIAMTPFLQQIFEEISRRAEAESGGDPTRRIQITKDLTDQVTRPVLEAAIGKSGQRMGNMAGPQARALSQTSARQRVGESAMEYDRMNSAADAEATKKAAMLSAGATLGAGLIQNWPEAAYEPKYAAPVARVQIPQSMQAPVIGPGYSAAAPESFQESTRRVPYEPNSGPSPTDSPQRDRMHKLADMVRAKKPMSDEEVTEWESQPDAIKNFALMPAVQESDLAGIFKRGGV